MPHSPVLQKTHPREPWAAQGGSASQPQPYLLLGAATLLSQVVGPTLKVISYTDKHEFPLRNAETEEDSAFYTQQRMYVLLIFL